ncbi:hypothetical protein [Streptomyces sp. CAU 1734]|uniref:hypothetical protein n=1 Tax=Streptomyces sp. CAU 1734 TaxID=3140360 RepID=UPI0032608069
MTAQALLRTWTATLEGTEGPSGDAAAVFTTADGTIGAAVVDLIGHEPGATDIARLLAQAAARVAARRGPLAGLLTAAELVADPGAGPSPEPTGAAIVATARPGRPVELAWIGDCGAASWDGTELRARTTVHTMGRFLRQHGATTVDLVHDDWIRLSLTEATATTVAMTEAPAGEMLMLMSDGVYAPHPGPGGLGASMVRAGSEHPQRLAEALVGIGVRPAQSGPRDDATVVILGPAG